MILIGEIFTTLRDAQSINVRYWHLADILCTRPYVRFWG